jgi:hypothetical protein
MDERYASYGLGPPLTPYCSLPAERKPRGDAGDGPVFGCRRPRDRFHPAAASAPRDRIGDFAIRE